MQKITMQQLKVRDKVNDTFKEIPDNLLHQGFFETAIKKPDNIALAWEENGKKRVMTYRKLYDRALKCAAYLKKNGIKINDNVAISMKKGPNQIIGILGILALGAVYVPIGIYQPDVRRELIYKMAKINVVVTDYESIGSIETTSNIKILCIEDSKEVEASSSYKKISCNNNAYIIFTSGTTGNPKGVEIQHCAINNTIYDINTKFSISDKDAILAISELDFDLSVYDIFGMLSIGGKIVLLNEDNKKEARTWSRLIDEEDVTLWNSVPAFFEMLLIGYAKKKMNDSIRLVLLSGDWIKPQLFRKFKEKSDIGNLIALGGATEASIWSNYFIVEHIKKEWKSIPYGYPLANQYYRIVDDEGNICPDYVPGKIQIGGKGLAKGYYNNTELTNERFIYEGKTRWYETGDIGQYWDNGCIEYLGRNDDQVKLRGFRIELGEIEHNLLKYPGIMEASVGLIPGKEKEYLGAIIVPDSNARIDYENINEPKIDSKVIKQLDRQTCAASVCLRKILGLEHNKITNVPEIMLSNSFVEEKTPLIKLWISWLEDKKIIENQNGNIKPGIYFSKTLEKNELTRSMEKEVEFVKRILRGEISKLEILNNQVLSPERLVLADIEMEKAITLMKEEIKNIRKMKGKTIKVAFLKSKTGIVASEILKDFDKDVVSATLIDTPAMNFKAQKRLEKLKKSCDYEILHDNYIEENLKYSFDLVISVNALHTYKRIKDGLQTIKHLLKKDGKSLVLEITYFSPISLITAAVLENGFENHIETKRQSTINPMLNEDEWTSLFKTIGFNNISIVTIHDTLAKMFRMEITNERNELCQEQIISYLKTILPEYMIPEKILTFYSIPLSINGKVDKSQIRTVFENISTEKLIESNQELKTETEKSIADIWESILNIKKIGHDGSFFELGGDSLLATHFINLIKEKYSVELSLKEMFEKSTLGKIATVVDLKYEEFKRVSETIEEGEI